MCSYEHSIDVDHTEGLLDELEASKQSRLRAWSVLQRLRMVLLTMLRELRGSMMTGLRDQDLRETV